MKYINISKWGPLNFYSFFIQEYEIFTGNKYKGSVNRDEIGPILSVFQNSIQAENKKLLTRSYISFAVHCLSKTGDDFKFLDLFLGPKSARLKQEFLLHVKEE